MRQRARPQLHAFIQTKRATDDRSARRRSTSELGAARATGLVFSPKRHGLSWEQRQLAARLLHRANLHRPLQGSPQAVQFRYSLRVAGIISAVRHGRVGASGWGRRMLATKGGNTVRDHALGHLRQWAPVARLAAMMARERKRAAQFYEEHGAVLPLGAPPTETPEQARVRSLQDAWEHSVWQQQRDRLTW